MPNSLKSILFLFMVWMAAGCTYNSLEYKTETVTVSNQDTLFYSLGHFGPESGASIIESPVYAEYFDLDRTNDAEVVFVYKAQPSFMGSDYVELRSARGSNGVSTNNHVMVTQLTINVQ